MSLNNETDNLDGMTGKELPNSFPENQFGKGNYDVTPNDIAGIHTFDRAKAQEQDAEPLVDDEPPVAPADDSTVSDNMDDAPAQESFGSWREAQTTTGDAEDVPIEGRFGYMAGGLDSGQTSQDVTQTTLPASRYGNDQTRFQSYASRTGHSDGSSYEPHANPYEQQVKQKKSGHLPWLLGGVAAGALIVGLGFSVMTPPAGDDGTSVPDHTTTQWEGTSEEKTDKKTGTSATPSSRDHGTESLTLASDVAERCLPSVVAIHVSDGTSAGMGSGVIIDDDGHVLTNSHVVKDMDEIVVVSGNGEEYTAKLLGLDDSSDLAVLNVEWGDADFTVMDYGDSSELKVGEWVMTIGSPYGLDQSVSTGIVSALSRNQMMESYGGYRIYANLIQTDAAINLGNSGGALVNADGKLVGINSMLASNSGSYSAVGFAIPSNYAKRVADQIIAGKEVEHAYIGAQFGNVSRISMMQQDDSHGTIIDESGQEVTPQDGSPTTGAYVAGVVDDSPAKKAGIQEGDIITKFGNERISSASGIILAVRAHEIGETVPVTIWRDGKEITLDVTLGSDAGKGLYDNDGSSAHQKPSQQYPSPYGGYDDEMDEYLRRLFEQFGFSE